MFDLADILMRAQNGEALRNMARQFGLPPEQVAAVVNTMAPAFAAAMQRQATNPDAFMAMMRAMSAGAGLPSNPWLDAVSAFSPAGRDAGTKVLEAVFGSREVAMAVGDQISTMTGVAQGVLQAMLPSVAAMLAGGLSADLDKNPIGQLMQGLVNGSGAPKSPQELYAALVKAMPRPTGETESVEDFLKRTPNPAGPASAFDETFGAFVRGFNRGRPEKKPEPAPELDIGDMFGRLFQAGKQASEANTQVFGEIFDRFWGAPKRDGK